MDLWSIVKKVGMGAIATMVPGGPLILKAINAYLPNDKQLPTDATGEEAQKAINTLSDQQQTALKTKQFDVQLAEIKESHSTARSMLETEAVSPHSTRPKIALGAFYVVSSISLLVTAGFLFAVLTHDAQMMTAITDGWPWLAAIVLPFVGWLNRYFGILATEQKQKLDAARNLPSAAGIKDLLKTFVS